MVTDDAHARQNQKTAGILIAARTHFAARGFEATKLADIAKDAGVAVGTIYLRYKGKSELLGGVLQSVETTFCEAVDTPEIWGTPFPRRFTLVMQAVIEHALSERDLGRLMALTSFATPTQDTSCETMRGMIARQLSDGVERGELRNDLDVILAARLAHGMVEGGMIELMTNLNRTKQSVINELAFASSRWLAQS